MSPSKSQYMSSKKSPFMSPLNPPWSPHKPQRSTLDIYDTLGSCWSQKGRPSGYKGFYHCLSKNNIWRRQYPVSNVKHNPSEATKEARVNVNLMQLIQERQYLFRDIFSISPYPVLPRSSLDSSHHYCALYWHSLSTILPLPTGIILMSYREGLSSTF